MKTIPEVLAELAAAGAPIQRRQLHRNLVLLDIRPVGMRQRPQRYPADTARRILVARGFVSERQEQPVRLATMAELRKERSRAKR